MSFPDDDLPEPTSHLRVPPHSLEAEQSVLGGLLLDNSAWDRVGDLLLPDDFYRHEHRSIYEVIGALINSTNTADVITVHERLKAKRGASDYGGLTYLNALAASVPSAANARRYAEIVREKALLRRTIAICDNAASRAFSAEDPADEQIGLLAAEVSQLEQGQTQSSPLQMDAVMVRVVDALNDMATGDSKHVRVWSTHLKRLNDLLRGGFRSGRVYLLGARPGKGKSALALWWATLLALHDDLTTLYLSQEMTTQEQGERACALVGQVSYTKIQTGTLNDYDWGQVSDAVEKLGRIAMHIDDQAALTINDIRIKARYVKGLNLLVLDFVQLCRGAEEGSDNRNAELERISRGIKTLAKTLHVAILVLSALGRKVDERRHERPIISDLRDCGALESDADVVMSLWDVGKVCGRKGDNGSRLMALEILKQRNGPLGHVVLDFWGDLMSWAETEYELDELLSKPKEKSGSGPL